MNILTDTHCHSMACDHAYSTVTELAAAARGKGLELIALTDHAPGMPDSAHEWHFSCLKFLPRKISEVVVLKGAEANIMDYDGRLDLPDYVLKPLELVIASLHRPCIPPGSREENTRAVLECIENPYVHVVGHIGTPQFPVDFPVIVRAAKEYHTLIELNNNSFLQRKGSKENCSEVARLCMEYGTPVTVSSDAHFASMVGGFDEVLQMLAEIGFPEELIVNTTAERLCSYLDLKINRR